LAPGSIPFFDPHNFSKGTGICPTAAAKNEAGAAIIFFPTKNFKKYIARAGTTVTIRDPLSIGGGRDVR
jgi:hypothetical protein